MGIDPMAKVNLRLENSCLQFSGTTHYNTIVQSGKPTGMECYDTNKEGRGGIRNEASTSSSEGLTKARHAKQSGGLAAPQDPGPPLLSLGPRPGPARPHAHLARARDAYAGGVLRDHLLPLRHPPHSAGHREDHRVPAEMARGGRRSGLGWSGFGWRGPPAAISMWGRGSSAGSWFRQGSGAPRPGAGAAGARSH